MKYNTYHAVLWSFRFHDLFLVVVPVAVELVIAKVVRQLSPFFCNLDDTLGGVWHY